MVVKRFHIKYEIFGVNFPQNTRFQFCFTYPLFQQESRKQNHQSVVEEDRQSKLPKNYDIKRKRQEWELEEMEERKVTVCFKLTFCERTNGSRWSYDCSLLKEELFYDFFENETLLS